MGIAVDQTNLRRIVEGLAPALRLDADEARSMLELAQLAAGVEADDNPAEHATLQAIAQQVCSMVGLEPSEVFEIPPVPEEQARGHWLASVARPLRTREARELAYALVFLVSVSDLQLTAAERSALQEFQRALQIDDRRATDVVVIVSETVAAPAQAGTEL
jgi:hypothetical protein